MKKTIAKAVLTALLLFPLVFSLEVAAGPPPNWDTTGNYVVKFNYFGSDYPHDMYLTQDEMGSLQGNGGYPAGGNHAYKWIISSGNVSGNAIEFKAYYTASADAVNPLTTMQVKGTIASDGTMSGTWSDNYQGQNRSGTWATSSGKATKLPETVKVTIAKYIDGSKATAQSAKNMSFPMTATWKADNIGAGTGQYSLSPSGFNSPTPYEAMTSAMTRGADYTTSEITTGSTVGSSCQTGQPYFLKGYKWGNSVSEAEQASLMTAPPAFTGLTKNKFVLVQNATCPEGSKQQGEIGGSVQEDQGMLKVDSVTVVKGSAMSDGTYENGWKYTFHITAPNNEPNLAMKFSNWLNGSNTIQVANNMRISSMQANNGGAKITLTAADTYSTPPLVMTADLNSTKSGRQVEVMVEVKIPSGTVSGSYSTTYGVKTNN